MSAGVVGHGSINGFESEPRGFWCLARLATTPCRAAVGLCDLCLMDLYCMLEAFVPVLVPALDAAAERDPEAAVVRRELDQALLGGVGLLFDPVEPVPDEERAWELLVEHYRPDDGPAVRTTVQLADELKYKLYYAASDPAVVLFAREVGAALVRADAVLHLGAAR